MKVGLQRTPLAAGLRIPVAMGDILMLRALRESNGMAITVSDEALAETRLRMSHLEGVFACPEGGATLAAPEQLVANGRIQAGERIVLINTGTGLKYPGAFTV